MRWMKSEVWGLTMLMPPLMEAAIGKVCRGWRIDVSVHQTMALHKWALKGGKAGEADGC
jgi:hypothetical protein